MFFTLIPNFSFLLSFFKNFGFLFLRCALDLPFKLEIHGPYHQEIIFSSMIDVKETCYHVNAT
jgi:hypothetical protein